ncbi:hypothetical protein B0J17DRAFT_721868 [Rhizoctonia solani]|nr:hypothetical protein B0J17DRAFT_721868 [Rhizoctonia solani]
MMFFQNKKKATTSQPIKRSSSRCSSIQSTVEISKTDGRRNAIYGTSSSQSRMSIDSTDSLDSLMPVYPPSDCSSIRSCSRSSTSDKSVRFSDTEDELHPGQYSSGSPRSSPRPVLKSKAASMSLLSFQHDPFRPPLKLLILSFTDWNVVLSLEDCVDKFEYPSELDFSTSAKDEMNLVQNVKNRQFIDQLHQLDSLREDLNAISIYGIKQLEQERKNASIANWTLSSKPEAAPTYPYMKAYKPRNYIEELAPSPTAEDFEVPVLEKCISARRNKDGTYMSMEFAGFEQVN